MRGEDCGDFYYNFEPHGPAFPLIKRSRKTVRFFILGGDMKIENAVKIHAEAARISREAWSAQCAARGTVVARELKARTWAAKELEKMAYKQKKALLK